MRHRQQQAEAATQQLDEHFQKDLVGRFGRLARVKRFTIGWLLLIILLIASSLLQILNLNSLFQIDRPAYGGVYNEGIVGTYSTSNPIYASGEVDASISKLLYDGLFTYNDKNQLVGNLARGYTISEDGKTYAVELKPNLKWQDGHKLTADDVVFTFHLIQNPDVHSPYFASWQGIVVRKIDSKTIGFNLSSALSAFPYSLTMGILPKHIMEHIPASELRANNFNTTKPVGSGPFKWDALQLGSISGSGKTTALIALKANTDYHGDRPHLNSFVFHTYETEDDLIKAFKNRDVNAMAGLKNIPKNIKKDKTVNAYNFPTTAAVMVFFRMSAGPLAEAPVRQALVYGTSRSSIIAAIGGNLKLVREPILISQSAYDPAYEQPLYNPAEAVKLLDQAGWVMGSNGIRSKNGVALTFRMYAEDTLDNHAIGSQLKKQWKNIGVDLTVEFQQPLDLQTTLELHLYDILLRGISIGPDPDVFAYWDSSQADPRTNHLNFSEYKSSTADNSLEAGRTRQDPAIRALKYKPFLKAWQQDAPAIGLYSPQINYYTRGTVQGLTEHIINTDVDRYNYITQWSIHVTRVTHN